MEEIENIQTKPDYDKVIKSIEASKEPDDQAKLIVKDFAGEKYFRVKSGIETGEITEVKKIKPKESGKFEERSLDEVNGVGRFTTRQIDDYVVTATKNKDAKKVMLGKTDGDEITGYVSRAGNDHAYFKMTKNQWTEVLNSANGNLDEMWRINKEFIDKRRALGNEFYLSHNPSIADGFYFREIDYLTKSSKPRWVGWNN